MIGRILKNRYKILREIGSGGMARIYLAQDRLEEKQVAIKILHPQFNEDPAFIQRFNREAMLARTLDEPHIVRVLEDGVEGSLHFLVMEYVEGPNLHHLIRKKKAFKWQAALKIMHQLLIALEHAHSHGVIHRDIKPQNLVLTQAGLLKVLDFGIARIPSLPALTQTGAVIGSPQYVSPEQVRGKEVGFASDIYSAGLVLYELLAGTSLFEGESAWSIIGYYMSYKPLPMKLPAGEIPERVLVLLNQMLARQPEDRPQALAVREEIEAILALPAEPEAPNKWRQPGIELQKVRSGFNQKSWKNLWQIGLASGIVVLMVCLVLLSFGTDTRALEEESRTRLKSLYEEAHLEIELGNRAGAISKLDQILSEDPNYADAAALQRELTHHDLPAPTVIPAAKPIPNTDSEEARVSQLLLQAQTDINGHHWTETISVLEPVGLTLESEYQRARVTAVLCEAYLGRGQEALLKAAATPAEEKTFVRQAQADFEPGVAACPRRTDLRKGAEQASAYLKALTLGWYNYDKLIQTLTPLVATSPNYMQGRAKIILYEAYLRRALARQLTAEPVAAILADYDAALALQVADPVEAQTRRAKLLQSIVQPAPKAPAEETKPVAPAPSTAKAEPTPNPVKYGQPLLIGPVNDTVFAGRYSNVYLEWQPAGQLAPNEYYDVTIMHLFAGEPLYLGSTRTRETRIKIGDEIGVGQAAADRFYWWITVRKDESAPAQGSLDLPLSPQSEVRTFIWSS